METKIFFRADGHAKIGLGHVIRSLALADMLKDEFECHFIIRNPLPTLRNQILEVCKTIVELQEPSGYLEEAQYISNIILTGQEIIVLDGYYFDTLYQKAIKSKGCKLVCIDDIHSYHFLADVIINHAGGISPKDYSAEAYTQYYLGLKFALLRKPFFEAAAHSVYSERSQSVFICLGGADPDNATLTVLKKCENIIPNHKCFLTIGGAYLHKKNLIEYLRTSPLEVEVLENLNAEQMVNCMKKCYMAITPPSTIAFEYLSIGGLLFLKVIADNQKNINDYFIESGLAFDYEKHFYNLTKKREADSLEKQKSIFDGKTKERYLMLFNKISQRDVSVPFS